MSAYSDGTGHVSAQAARAAEDVGTPPRLRAHAAENRARIVSAAREVLATSDAPRLNAIAKAAGVGQGTLYRHFPTRGHLLAEVYRHEVGELVAAAPRLLTEHGPLDALGRWFDQVADYARVKRGVMAAVEASTWHDLATGSHGSIGAAVTLLLDAGKADGLVRPDVDAADVILLIGYLARVDGAEWATRAHRLLSVVLDGLRPRA